MTERAFVVGLSGIPGAGKTTLTHLLLRDLKAAGVVYYDQFQTLTRMMPAQVRDWFARGGDPNEFALTELIGELTRQTQTRLGEKRRPLVLFETPLGRLHRASGAFIDFLIWIDTPLDVALSRAILAFLDAAQRDKAPNAPSEFVKWQTQYMLNYPIVRPMYLAQRESISSSAELVLDGSRPADESVVAVREALSARGIVA
jgi:uridine kinase